MRYNTSIKSKERNDCTVRALSAAAGVTYETARKALHEAGRKPNRGFHLAATIRNHGIKGFRFTWVRDPLTPRSDKALTLKQFIKAYTTGTYLVIKTGHAFAVRNGTVVDTCRPGARTRVTHAWQVEITGGGWAKADPNFNLPY